MGNVIDLLSHPLAIAREAKRELEKLHKLEIVVPSPEESSHINYLYWITRGFRFFGTMKELDEYSDTGIDFD